MPTLQLPNPSPKQKRFIQSRTKHLAFGGSRGGGKSFAVRLAAIIYAYQYPGIKIIIMRKTYPELTANHIMPMTELLRCYARNRDDRLASYNDQKKMITFPNGSSIRFQYCESEKDADRMQGTECHVLFLDEATMFTEEVVKKLTACVRSVDDIPKLIRYTCNPGNVGHGWVKRLFIDRAFNDGEDPNEYEFIQSSVYDNRALLATNKDYIKQLEALPPRLRDMWLYGRWDVAEGVVFSEFRTTPDIALAHELGFTDDEQQLLRERRFTHVIEPIDLSVGQARHWTIFRSYDFGYSKCYSCGWWAVDYDGTMYRIMEDYGCTGVPNEGVRLTPDQQFARIHEIETTHPWLMGKEILGVADPAIWDASRGEAIVETATKHGVYFSKGENKRIPGWMQVHYRMQFDSEGYPRMYIFNNCKDFIRTIPLLTYDDRKPEDVATELEDHIADETRYACASRPVAPIKPIVPKQRFYDPLNQFK